jgi:broad specificity phosphatase PhoE
MKSAADASGTCSRLVLVRHAHTAMAGTFCGTSDPPLSAQGIAQLDGLRQRLEVYPLTHIFSSNLQRARQTAESIALRCGLQVHYLDFLHELAFGSWEGLDWDQIVARDREYAQRWLDLYPSIPAPGGEIFEHFLQRIQHAMTSIAGQVEDGCAVVVTHAGVIRTFLGDIARPRGISLDLTACDYASCWEVWRKAGQWHMPRPGAPIEVKVTTQPSRVGY